MKDIKELTLEQYESMRCYERLIFQREVEIMKFKEKLKKYYDILEKNDD